MRASLAMVACLVACATPPATNDAFAPIDVGRPDAGPMPDVGFPPDTGAMAIVPNDGGYAPVGPGTPFTAANETWVGVTIDGSHCGNGSPYVVAVNLTNRSNDLLVYFQGGGACFDANTCFDVGTATHVNDTLTPMDVVSEAMFETGFEFMRDPQNPFANMNYLYLPYCTGDVFAGNVVATFTTSSGPRMMHFEGANDMDLVLARATATWPSTTHIVMMGVSAGGYGVLTNWWRMQAAFHGVRVDAITDSGLPVNPPPARWNQFVSTWGLDGPPDCPSCATLTDVMAYYARTMTPPHRLGLLAFLDDAVIPTYDMVPVAEIHTGLLEVRNQMALTPNQRTFYVNQSGHVLNLTPDTLHAGAGGPTPRQWITSLVTDDPTWGDVGP
jgi:hypothetical protein